MHRLIWSEMEAGLFGFGLAGSAILCERSTQDLREIAAVALVLGDLTGGVIGFFYGGLTSGIVEWALDEPTTGQSMSVRGKAENTAHDYLRQWGKASLIEICQY